MHHSEDYSINMYIGMDGQRWLPKQASSWPKCSGQSHLEFEVWVGIQKEIFDERNLVQQYSPIKSYVFGFFM